MGLDRLGLSVTAVIRISAPEEKCAALKACLKGLPEIVECHHVTGSDSYVLRPVTTSVHRRRGPLARSATRRAAERQPSGAAPARRR